MAKFSPALFCQRFVGIPLAMFVRTLASACAAMSTDMSTKGYKVIANVYSALSQALARAGKALPKGASISARKYFTIINAVGVNATHNGEAKENATWNFLVALAKTEAKKAKGKDAPLYRAALREILKAHKIYKGEVADLPPTLPEFVRTPKS